MAHKHKWEYVTKSGYKASFIEAETRRCMDCQEIQMKTVEWVRMVPATMPENKDGD